MKNETLKYRGEISKIIMKQHERRQYKCVGNLKLYWWKRLNDGFIISSEKYQSEILKMRMDMVNSMKKARWNVDKK